MKKSQQTDHPELLLGPNPLLEGMAPYLPTSKLPAALLREPLRTVNWRELPPELRTPLLELQPNHFYPTPDAVDVAEAIQRAMRGSLMLRNPLQPAEQKRINQIATLLSTQRASLPMLQSLACIASGGIIAAETGIGKTTIVRRVLETLIEDQFIVHSRSEACGWERLTQVYYLHVNLPSNSSRGGLLASILGGLDALLGLDYMSQLRRCKVLDEKIIFVLKTLALHRVALIVLDEGQVENLDECEWQREFVLFFLAIMNLGVPVLLCGHPDAFRTLRSTGQLVRRFSSIGAFHLERAKNDKATWWRNYFVKGMLRFNLCDETENPEGIVQLARECSAGVPHLFAAQWTEAQRIALNRGGRKATLKLSDFEQASHSRRFREVKRMVRWLNGVGEPGSFFSDLTVAPPDVAQVTNGSSPSARSSSATNQSSRKAAVSLLDRIQRQAKGKASKKSAQMKKVQDLIKKLSPEDLRSATTTIEILAGLDGMQSELLADKT